MTKTTSVCYCDILTEHNNSLVEGASHYKNVFVMTPIQGEEDKEEPVIISSLDMCPACYAKYKSSLHMTYDTRRQPVYSFDSNSSETVIEEPIDNIEEPAEG